MDEVEESERTMVAEGRAYFRCGSVQSIHAERVYASVDKVQGQVCRQVVMSRPPAVLE